MLKVNHPPYMPGQTVQVVNTQTGAVATGNTQMPHDDSIPQKTEGDEYMTLAITPRATTNKLKIEVVFCCNLSAVENLTGTVALFQDEIANALAAAPTHRVHSTGINIQNPVSFSFFMAANTVLEIIFKVRAGANAPATLTFNGYLGARKLGGVMASSITITEFKD